MKPAIIQIPLPPFFSFEECLWFLDRNYDDCLHTVADGKVTKAIVIDGRPLLICVSAGEKTLDIAILHGPAGEDTIRQVRDYVINWLDLDKDMAAFYRLLKKNKKVAYMASAFEGLRLISIPDLFEAICWSVMGQQINLTFAYKLKRRLVERYGTTIAHGHDTYHLFPSPEVLAAAGMEDLKAMQFSAAKAGYLIETASAFACGTVSREKLLALPDFLSRQNMLTDMKGVGIWTANYTLMKSLKIPDCIPYGDAGLLNALIAHDILKDKKDLLPMHTFFKRFGGWESYVVFYLWRSLAKK